MKKSGQLSPSRPGKATHEKWAGPAHVNSPPASNLPRPRFNMKPEINPNPAFQTAGALYEEEADATYRKTSPHIPPFPMMIEPKPTLKGGLRSDSSPPAVPLPSNTDKSANAILFHQASETISCSPNQRCPVSATATLKDMLKLL